MSACDRYVIKKLVLPGRKHVSDIVDADFLDTQLGQRPEDVFFVRFSKCQVVDENSLKFTLEQGQDTHYVPLSSFQFCFLSILSMLSPQYRCFVSKN